MNKTMRAAQFPHAGGAIELTMTPVPAGASSLRNEKGVVINVTGVGQGFACRLPVSDRDVKLVM